MNKNVSNISLHLPSISHAFAMKHNLHIPLVRYETFHYMFVIFNDDVEEVFLKISSTNVVLCVANEIKFTRICSGCIKND